MKETINAIELLLAEGDRDISLDMFAEFADTLMDPDWSSYKMFEGLVTDYINGNDDVKKGIDLALSALTGWNMNSIAKKLIDRNREENENFCSSEDDTKENDQTPVKELPVSYRYWSNSCGDLFTPTLETRVDIYADQLPKELKRVYKKLWSEDYGFRCYLADLDGQYGMAIEDEFEESTAKDHGKNFEDLITKEKEFVKMLEFTYPEYKIFFKRDHHEWSDGSKSSVVAIFIPWDENPNYVKSFVKNMTMFWKDIVGKFLNV